MSDEKTTTLNVDQLALALENVPAGITIVDPRGCILYYNEFCARYVDRKPEYIGKDIRFCHQKPESIEKIGRILSDLASGKRGEYRYAAVRNGVKLVVTVVPFKDGEQLLGFIQSFVPVEETTS